MACFSGRAGTALKMARRATTRPGTMHCSMEAPPSGCRRRSVRGVHRRRDPIAYPRVGNPPAPDLSSTSVRAELAATGSRGDGGGIEMRAGGGGRRGLWSKAAARGRRGWGRPAGSWVLAAWPLGLGSCRARAGGWRRGRGGRGVERHRGATEGGRSLGERGGWPVGPRAGIGSCFFGSCLVPSIVPGPFGIL
jgi:hypothetical protein